MAHSPAVSGVPNPLFTNMSGSACSVHLDNANTCSVELCCPFLLECSLALSGIAGPSPLLEEVSTVVMKDFVILMRFSMMLTTEASNTLLQFPLQAWCPISPQPWMLLSLWLWKLLYQIADR